MNVIFLIIFIIALGIIIFSLMQGIATWNKNNQSPRLTVSAVVVAKRENITHLYDYSNGKIYEPFQKQRNVLYGRPVYLKGCFWFLQGDYNSGKITLFKYLPDEIPEIITQLNIVDVNPYNLRIIGEDVCITSEDDEFVCYYPENFRFSMNPNENVQIIADGKVYLSAWVEEGWDEEKYYEKVVVRDFNGRILSETLGCLQQRPDGTWWIA